MQYTLGGQPWLRRSRPGTRVGPPHKCMALDMTIPRAHRYSPCARLASAWYCSGAGLPPQLQCPCCPTPSLSEMSASPSFTPWSQFTPCQPLTACHSLCNLSAWFARAEDAAAEGASRVATVVRGPALSVSLPSTLSRLGRPCSCSCCSWQRWASTGSASHMAERDGRYSMYPGGRWSSCSCVCLAASPLNPSVNLQARSTAAGMLAAHVARSARFGAQWQLPWLLSCSPCCSCCCLYFCSRATARAACGMSSGRLAGSRAVSLHSTGDRGSSMRHLRSKGGVLITFIPSKLIKLVSLTCQQHRGDQDLLCNGGSPQAMTDTQPHHGLVYVVWHVWRPSLRKLKIQIKHPNL